MLGELPAPQRHALEAALLLADPDASPPEPQAIPIAKASILGARFSTAGGFKVAKTQLSVVLTTNGCDTLTVKNGVLHVWIAAIKSGALPGLKALVRR